jgi:hypothetical protein
MKTSFSSAFAKFGAKLANPMNQTMAISKTGDIVMSLWPQLFDAKSGFVADNSRRYHLHQWTFDMVKEAFESQRKVRFVIPQYYGHLPEGRSHSGLADNFRAARELVGEFAGFDYESGEFVIRYYRDTPN